MPPSFHSSQGLPTGLATLISIPHFGLNEERETYTRLEPITKPQNITTSSTLPVVKPGSSAQDLEGFD